MVAENRHLLVTVGSVIFRLADGHSTRRPSFRFGESTYNALNNNSLSQFLFILLWHYLYLLSCATSSPRRWPTLGRNDTIYVPALLTLDDGAEAGFSKEPSVDPIRQGLTEIVLPGCSGLAAVMVDRLSCLCLLLASYCIVQYLTYNTKWRIPLLVRYTIAYLTFLTLSSM